MIFQIFILLVIAGILLFGLRTAQKRESAVFLRIVWTVFWVGAAFVVWRPELTTRVAQLVGIGRGVDLVLYLAIIVLTAVVFSLVFWVDALDASITTLARHVALNEYERNESQPTSSNPDSNL